MKLDRILSNLGIRVEPFAVCDIHHGYRLRLPLHSETLLHFVVGGSGRLRAAGKTYAIASRTLVVIPPSLPHAFESESPVEEELRVEAIDPSTFAEVVAGSEQAADAALVMSCGRIVATFGDVVPLFGQLREPIVRQLESNEAVRHVFSEIHREQRNQPPGTLFMQQQLMSQVVVHLFRELCETGDCALPWLEALTDERLGRAIDKILDEPGSPHTLESLASAAGMSRSSFAERFSGAFGRTAMEMLKEVRLRRAAALLCSTDLPIKTVAARVGFSSRSHFSRAFKELFARGPSTFREAPAQPDGS